MENILYFQNNNNTLRIISETAESATVKLRKYVDETALAYDLHILGVLTKYCKFIKDQKKLNSS